MNREFEKRKRQIEWTQNHYKHVLKQNLNHQKIKQKSLEGLRVGHQWLATTRPYYYGRIGLAIALIGRLGYVYGTKFEKQITVTRSLNRIAEKNGIPKNEYLISDEKHNLYQIRSSFWYWQWFPTELWTEFHQGDTYLVTGYGIRIKSLGIHPVIVKSHPLN